MSTSDPDSQTELLRSIAASLKGIQNSLDQLTGAVEGVAESIEQAHEPEGDLGVHLVGALKELSSALHKRANQERSQQERPPQPPLRQQHNAPRHPQHQDRQGNQRGLQPGAEQHTPAYPEERLSHTEEDHLSEIPERNEIHEPHPESAPKPHLESARKPQAPREQRQRKPRPRRRRGAGAPGAPQPPLPPTPSEGASEGSPEQG